MRVTLIDIARTAGVSPATVDRVLNDRGNVHARTVQRVRAVARDLGYLAGDTASGPSSATALSFDFLLPAGRNDFIGLLVSELQQQASARDDVVPRVHVVEGFSGPALADALLSLDGKTDGVGVVAIDHPAVRNALRHLAAKGTPVVTLATDIPNVPRLGYVGIDNRAAGRLAGYLLHRFLGEGRHKLALLAGSIAYRGHEEREMGFRHIISEHAQTLEIVAFDQVRDDDERAYAATAALLRTHPDLSGIYSIGAGNAGIARALKEAGAAARIVFIGHDLTALTRALLLDGTMDAVIDQNPRVQARDVLEQLSRAHSHMQWNAHPLRTQAIFRENLPEEADR